MATLPLALPILLLHLGPQATQDFLRARGKGTTRVVQDIVELVRVQSYRQLLVRTRNPIPLEAAILGALVDAAQFPKVIHARSPVLVICGGHRLDETEATPSEVQSRRGGLVTLRARLRVG